MNTVIFPLLLNSRKCVFGLKTLEVKFVFLTLRQVRNQFAEKRHEFETVTAARARQDDIARD